MVRILTWAVCAALVVGCAFPIGLGRSTVADPPRAQSSAQVAPLVGRVDFGGARYQTRTTIGDIANAATVSLIDTSLNQTVATTVTSGAGEFNLGFSGWSPTADRVYILEGVKGLNDNRPSSHAARVRTFVRMTAGSWETITVGRLTINTSTTAICIVEGLYQANNRPGPGSDPGNSINLIPAAATQAGDPDPLQAGQSVMTQATYEKVFGLVKEAVTGDRDPVSSIKYKPLPIDDFWSEAGTGPAITGLTPDIGTAGTFVTIYGSNFKTATESNTVTFNGMPVNPLSSSETSMVVRVPAGATSGPVKVKTSEGESGEVAFAVIAGFDGNFKAN